MTEGRSEIIITGANGNVTRKPLTMNGKPVRAGDLKSGREYEVAPDGTITEAKPAKN